jgi:hypothetical protein
MWEEKALNRTVFDLQRVRKDVGSSWVGGEEYSDNTFDVLQVETT